MFESNTYREKPTNLRCDTNRNCLEKIAEQGRNTSYWKQLLSFCNTDDCFKLDDVPSFGQKLALVGSPVAMDYHNRIAPYPSTSNFATTQGRLDHQVVEPNAHFQEPKLYHNMINGNSTEPVLNNDHLLSCNQNISAPGPSTSNYATFMGGSDKQEFEQNIQDPYNFNANLTEPTENGWYLPCYYAPTVPPITDQGTYNAIEEQQFALHNTQHGQMFQPDANVQEPYNSSYNFETISTEPMEMSNDLPIYNHKIIAPGPSTSNWGTTVPGNIDYGFSFEEWELVTSEP